MKVLYSWLKEYVPVDLPARGLSDKLTMAGLEVTDIQSVPGGDSILDFDLTTNRGDCLGILGIAREVSALTGLPLNPPDIDLQEGGEDIHDLVTVRVDELKGCPRYSARMIRNVKLGSSPQWLKARLRASDIRPINNIVDVTNYYMLELGQPLHAFDYETLGGSSIRVRNAKEGESITTLDEVARTLTRDTLVIADSKRPVAIAGIMGGLRSQVSSSTRTVLIESAHFDPIRIRRSSQKLGLHTASSHRFEREPDPAGTIMALNRSAQLMRSLCGGEVVRGIIDIYPALVEPIVLSLEPERVNWVLGTRLSAEQMAKLLARLGFKVDLRGGILVRVPTFRRDVTRPIDLIEEIARIYGYWQIPATMPYGRATPAQQSFEQAVSSRAVEILLGCGLNEVINYSFISPDDLDRLRLPKNSKLRRTVNLRNPIRAGQDVMRTTLIPGLLRTLAHNLNRGNLSVKIFELGRVFLPDSSQVLPHERKVLSGLISGPRGEGLCGSREDVDFYDLKGIVEELLEGLAVPSCQIIGVSCPFLQPGRAAKISVRRVGLGVLGKVHPEVASWYGIDRCAYIFELDFKKLTKLVSSKRTYHPLAKYPGIRRDISLIVSEDISSQKIYDLIFRVGGRLVEEVTLFDVYRGKEISEDKMSLAYSIIYRSEDGTLTDREVCSLHEMVCQRLVEDLGVQIRR